MAFTGLAASLPTGVIRRADGAAPGGLRSQLQPHRRCRRRCLPPLASAAGSVPAPDSGSSSSSSGVPDAGQPASSSGVPDAGQPAASGAAPQQPSSTGGGLFGWLRAQQQKSAELRARLASLGLAAVLSYGLFDGVSYTVAFSLAFLGYEARTGLNPTQNVADIVKICILMWAGNNVTRPFRLAGAAALAPFMDKVMDRLQARLGLRNKAGAFAILTAAVAGVCFAVLGGIFFSRWVRG